MKLIIYTKQAPDHMPKGIGTDACIVAVKTEGIPLLHILRDRSHRLGTYATIEDILEVME